MPRTLTVIAAVGLALAMSGTAHAQRSLVIERFDAEIAVGADGTVTVAETIRPRFSGRWNGLYRTIPIQYVTPQGFNYTLRVTLDSVTDERGTPLRADTSRERHYLKIKIWVPEAEDATRSVLVRYRVANALRFFDEHDELYWNVTGDEWDVPIESASARIALPAGVDGVRVAAFTGGYGSRERHAETTVADRTVTVRSTTGLNFREGLTVAVAWNPGVISRPTASDRATSFLASNVVFAAPLAACGLMWWLWRTRGRDPRRAPLVVQYEPPADLRPGELGTLIDNSPDMRDITATLVDLAVRGFLIIEEKEQSRFFGLLTDKDYAFRLRKPEREWTGLRAHERKLLEGVFAGRPHTTAEEAGGDYASVSLSMLKKDFYRSLPGIRNRIFEQLVDRGYYPRRPDRVRALWIGLAVASGLAVGVGGALISERFGVAPLGSIVAGGLTFGVVFGFGWFMPVRTPKGAQVLDGALGFQEFLGRVEADRLARVVRTPEMFERFLPYAMAFGVEQQWADAFEDICKEPPRWYVGSTPVASFRAGSFSSDLARMSTAAAAVMVSAPRGSGGSGFSGGGSSGGGFGGGGGGGF